ncbi:hypothetical protein [Roseovarius sp.]|uniref:hypothetical protein n=1 Tax=Roseovarius sp. TaxID=1486281 RepID=UPI002600D9FB|nr:hypothetical protein [Roseovarius sp.]
MFADLIKDALPHPTSTSSSATGQTPAHRPRPVIAAAFGAYLAGHVTTLQGDMQAGLGAISETGGSR